MSGGMRMSAPCTGLWPTPKADGNRNSRKAIMGGHPKHPASRILAGASSRSGGWSVTARNERFDGVTVPVSGRDDCPACLPAVDVICGGFPCQPHSSAGRRLGPPTAATSGPSSPDSFASVNPDGSWRKTCQGYSQVTLDGSLEPFSETWPRAGMTRSGTAYRLPPSAPLTDATASGSWPTPNAVETINPNELYASTTNASYPDGRKCQPTLSDVATRDPGRPRAGSSGRRAVISRRCDDAWLTLTGAVRLWPTPTAMTSSGGSAMCKWGGSGARAKLRAMTTAAGTQWAVEPDVGRVAHGVPARVDRLRGLGNAIVPQIAEWIARRILAAEGIA